MRHQIRALLLFCFAVLISLAACSSPSGGSSPPPDDPPVIEELDCELEGYPCTRSEVDPAILEVEGEYMDHVSDMLMNDYTMAEALDWILQQEQVVEAEADGTTLYFRLAGGQRAWIVVVEEDQEQTASLNVTFTPEGRPDSHDLSPSGVVGEGTFRDVDRDDHDKRALFLTPFEWQSGNSFAEAMAELKTIPDYNYDVLGVHHESNQSVTPDWFSDWNEWDAIFLRTHGGSLADQTFLSTGVIEARLAFDSR